MKKADEAPESPSVAVNWAAAKRRLSLNQTAIDQGFQPSSQTQRRILRERARTLAQEPAATREGSEILELVEFTISGERYALETAWVREVYPLKNLTAVPCTPPFILGIINIRGEIITVIDLRKFFALPEKGLTNLSKVIVLEDAQMEFGVLADVVLGVSYLDVEALQPSLPTLTGIQAEYLKGVTGDRLVVLDAAEILMDRKMVVHEDLGK